MLQLLTNVFNINLQYLHVVEQYTRGYQKEKYVIMERVPIHLPCSHDSEYEVKEHTHQPRKFSGDIVTFHGKGTRKMGDLRKQ